MNQVVITGVGPVSCNGVGKTAFAEALGKQASGIGPLTRFAGEHLAAEIRDFRLEDYLPSQKTYLDRAAEFALAAAQLALTDADLLPLDDSLRWRAGVVLGSEYGCLNTLQTFTAGLQQKGARLANPLLFSHSYVNTPTSLCAIEFGLGGHHGTFAGAHAGEQTLESAIEALQLNRADIIVALGVDAISEPLYRALSAEGALGEDAIGEGACALVLETAGHAEARGAVRYALPEVEDVAGLRGMLGRTFAAETFFAVAATLSR